MELAENKDLKVQSAIMTSLVGTQKGGLIGIELMFANNSYCTKMIKIPASDFYVEAFKATSKLCLRKEIKNLYTEKVFYNPLFTNANGTTLFITDAARRKKCFYTEK